MVEEEAGRGVSDERGLTPAQRRKFDQRLGRLLLNPATGQRLVGAAEVEDANLAGVHASGSADNSLNASGAIYVFE